MLVSRVVNVRAAWFLLPVVLFVALVVGQMQSARVPTRAHWAEATERVRAGRTPTDAVLWAPYSQGEGRIFFEGLNAQHAELETADLARWDTVWLFTSHGRSAADLTWPHTVTDTGHFGPLTVERLVVGGERVVGDLYAGLEKTRVRRIDTPGNETVCGFWSGRGWHCTLRDAPETTRRCLGAPTAQRLARREKDPECGLDPLLHVSRDVRLIGDLPRRCVWIHPVQGQRVLIDWPEAVAAQVLQIDVGFSDPMVADNYKRQLKVKPARIRTLRSDVELETFEVPAEKGWHRQRIELPEGAAPLTFEVSAASTADAHLCFDPTLRAARAEGGKTP